jgi:hypothetical protein
LRNYIYYLSISILLFSTQWIQGQNGFRFFDDAKRYEDVSFQLINNLIVIPLEINGKSLSFILDTGVNKTIVFNSAQADTVFLRMQDKYQLRGLGNGKPVNAIISRNNRFRINDMVSHNQSVFIVLKDEFDLSAKMGITIHGVIGYDILKNLILRIDYKKKKIRFYDPEQYSFKKCRKCEVFPLTIYQNKPYIDVKIQMKESGKKIPVKMLIDSGGSDALWLFEHSKKEIVTPETYFEDFLGVGLSGTIYGKRSRIAGLEIGDFRIKEPTVSFLDSISTQNARRYKKRNGSIGSNILKRFKVWIDYPNQRVMFKKNGPLTGGFEYNMSGIEVVYNGKVLVQERSTRFGESYGRSANSTGTAGNSVTLVTSFEFKFKPSFRVNDVLKGSPADLAGVKKGDVLLRLNGKAVHDFTLTEIIAKFQRKPNAKIKLVVRRDDQILTFEFRLKKIV